MLNKYICIGNLVKDPELVELSNGANLCKFSLAINDPIKKDDVLFMDIECWNKVAENTGKFLKKGAKCLVEGRLISNTWKSNDVTRTKIFVRADSVTFFPKSINGNVQPTATNELTKEESPLSDEEMEILSDAPF